MRNEITKQKKKILLTLYEERCMPTTEISLYCEFLKTKGIRIGESYLYRVLRELITTEYVERIKIGYQQKGVIKENYERKSRRRIKNIYRLTKKGEQYVEQELLKEKSGEIRIKEREKFTLKDANENERYLRILKTEIFGKVCEASGVGKEVTYISNEEIREELKNKGAYGSRLTGVIKIRNLDDEEEVMPIYSTGGYLTAQSKKTERKMKGEIERIYKREVKEEIILGENYEVLQQNLMTLIRREEARRKAKNETRITKARALLIETDKTAYTHKYFHPINLNGISQLKNYEVPKGVRKRYYQKKLSQDAELKKYFDKASIARAETSTLYDSITEKEYVFVGYELEIGKLEKLYKEAFRRTGITENGLVIICQEEQREFYKAMYGQELTDTLGTVKYVKILSTKEYL